MKKYLLDDLSKCTDYLTEQTFKSSAAQIHIARWKRLSCTKGRNLYDIFGSGMKESNLIIFTAAHAHFLINLGMRHVVRRHYPAKSVVRSCRRIFLRPVLCGHFLQRVRVPVECQAHALWIKTSRSMPLAKFIQNKAGPLVLIFVYCQAG